MDDLREYLIEVNGCFFQADEVDVDALKRAINHIYMDGYQDGFKAGHTIGATEGKADNG
jgi:hypothetical protein